eukprot:scaffold71462_cov64-Phaeocystis_antarctica.AAC.2
MLFINARRPYTQATPKDGNEPCSWQSASATRTPRAPPISHPSPSTLTPYIPVLGAAAVKAACGVWGDCRVEPQPCLLPCLRCRLASSKGHSGRLTRKRARADAPHADVLIVCTQLWDPKSSHLHSLSSASVPAQPVMWFLVPSTTRSSAPCLQGGAPI